MSTTGFACIDCGHREERACDIHNCKNMLSPDESHGCSYWQMLGMDNSKRCAECTAFSYSTPAKTFGRCSRNKSILHEIHGRWFACELFEKEGEDVPKKTFYTKCGREFQKSSTAEVTGYELEEKDGKIIDEACVKCPFPIDVKEGWNGPHKRWECRAGSMPPNHNTEWRGSLDDKNTMQVLSLDALIMEEMRQFCESHPDLSASFNADSSADCRRSLSIGCSSNKKGLAAKKEFIEKFFNGRTAAPKSKERCSACGHNVDNGDQLAGHIYCDYKKRLMHKESEACAQFKPKEEASVCDGSQSTAGNDSCVPSSAETVATSKPDKQTATTAQPLNTSKEGYGDVLEAWENGEIDENGTPLNEQADDVFDNGQACRICGCTDNHSCEGSCYWIQEDLCSACACDKAECPFNDCNGGCTFQNEDPASEGYNDDVVKAADEFGCPKDDVLLAYKAITDPDSCDVPEPCDGCQWIPVKGKTTCNTIYVDQEAHGKCGWYRNALTNEMGELIYKHEFGEDKPENEPDDNIPEHNITISSNEIIGSNNDAVVFDYSTVDQETSNFLQQKADYINEIRIRSVVAIGKELKEAQDKLSSHNKYEGSFQKWIDSLGFKKSSAYNYIQAYEYVVQNLDNIDAADQIQPSLLFAISKPSAPAELQQAVLDGDITTHKQYQELLGKLHDTEARAKEAEGLAESISEVNKKNLQIGIEAATKVSELEGKVRQLKQQLDQQQIDQATNQEIESLKDDRKTLNDEIITLRKQLKDKPIEVPAVKVEEKYIVPSEVKNSIFNKVIGLYEGLRGLTSAEVQIFADGIDAIYRDEVVQALNDAVAVLNKIETAVWKYTS